MKLGICTTDFQRAPVEALFGKIAAMGFEAVQLAFDSIAEMQYEATGDIEIPERIDDVVVEKIDDSAKRHGLDIVAMNGTFNMAHPDASVREEGIRRYPAFAAAQKLGCPCLSLCTGTRSRERLWAYHPDNQRPDAWQDMMNTLRALARVAEAHDLTLAIETEYNNVVDTAEKARSAMDEAASNRVKMVIDCANLFHPGQAHPRHVREVIGHAFDVFGDDIVLAHGKDIAQTDGVEFCATGHGIVDFPFFLGLLADKGYDGPFLLHGIYDEALMPPALALIRGMLPK